MVFLELTGRDVQVMLELYCLFMSDVLKVSVQHVEPFFFFFTLR